MGMISPQLYLNGTPKHMVITLSNIRRCNCGILLVMTNSPQITTQSMKQYMKNWNGPHAVPSCALIVFYVY